MGCERFWLHARVNTSLDAPHTLPCLFLSYENPFFSLNLFYTRVQVFYLHVDSLERLNFIMDSDPTGHSIFEWARSSGECTTQTRHDGQSRKKCFRVLRDGGSNTNLVLVDGVGRFGRIQKWRSSKSRGHGDGAGRNWCTLPFCHA